MRRFAWIVAAAPCASTGAGAVKYMSIGAAVKKFIPADAKVLKVTKVPSAAEADDAAAPEKKKDGGW